MSVVRVPLAALAVLLIGAGSAARAENARLSAIRIDNFGIVNDHYYRGAQPTAADYPDLAALGVKTVIDLTRDGRDDEKGLVEAAGMKFVRIPLTTTEAPTGMAITQFLVAGDRSGESAGLRPLPGRTPSHGHDDRDLPDDPGWLDPGARV